MKKSFITGLVVLLPLMLTIAAALFFINLLTAPFFGIVHNIFNHLHFLRKGFFFFSQEQIVTFISQVAILALLFGFTILIGLLARWFFLNTFVSFSYAILRHIPILNKIYTTSKEVIKTLFSNKKGAFKKVALVPFPQTATYTLGFVTSEAPKQCSSAVNAELISVFIPTTPNPTSGYLLMFKKEDIIFLDMPVEKAIKFIISCGVVNPEELITEAEKPATALETKN